MPCGGIYPIKGTWVEEIFRPDGITPRDESKPEHRCWTCGRRGALHFCDEWDAFIHARCVPAFLQTDEGQIVIDHGHTVVLDFSMEVNMKSQISISVAMSWRKTLSERHTELVTLRNQNSIQETRFYGANVDKQRVIEPLYDVVALDRLINQVAREISRLDEAIKATNQATMVEAYFRDDAILGELEPRKPIA